MKSDARWSNAYASFSRRAAARLIDLLVVLSPCGLLYVANLEAGFPVKYTAVFDYKQPLTFDNFTTYDLPGVALTFIAIKLLIAFPYFALLESSRWQGTLGKIALDIKVTDLDGNRISFGRATGRYFLKSMSVALMMFGYLISFSDKRQAWHDYMAKTLVIRRAVFPAYHALPSCASRWLFELPFATGNDTPALSGYVCLFCRYRSSEKHFGCPRCGAIAYAEAGAARGLELMHGIVFTVVGFGFLYAGARVVGHVLAGETPWFILALIFAIGGVFAAGGVSAFFSRNWLVRLLLFAAQSRLR